MNISTNIGFEISILLFAAFLGYILAIRINQSIVIGEILLGLLIGPSVLGLVHYTEFVQGLAEIGAIFLLFIVGLECKFREVYTLRNSMIALSGVIFPFIGGYFLAKLFHFSTIQSVFVATALVATSVAITANVLKEMGKLNTEAAKAIIGAAVIDDVLSIFVLSIVTGAVKSSITTWDIILKIIIVILFLIIGTFLGNVLSHFLHRTDKWAFRKKVPELTFIVAMIIAFGYSFLAELVGLSAIIGAFIAGVSLENLNIRTYREGAKYMEILFASIFFVSLGVLVKINVIWSVFLFLIILIIVAAVTKFIGCYVPARFFGLNKKESLVVGVGMIPRGEVAMIVALFGLTNELITQNIYTSIVLMSLITTILVPFFLKLIYHEKDDSGKKEYIRHLPYKKEPWWKRTRDILFDFE